MIPVTILTGFLGSGKTTLLNRLFRERPPGRGKMAIIVNELGDVGIDGDLLPPGDTRQVELPGGCICCALVEDLQTTLLELLASSPALEHIAIETTGIADPLGISWTLAAPPLDARLRLAAVVTVVDPLEHEASRRQGPSADAQVRYADILVLSKLDASGGPPPPALLASLRQRNDAAPILSEPPEQVAPALWRLLDDPALPAAQLSESSAKNAHAHAHAHGSGMESAVLPAADTLDLEDLVEALEELPPDIVRVKGIVRAIDRESGSSEPGLFAVHRVGARVSTEPYRGPETATRLVAIGRRVDSAHVAACLRAAVVRF